MNGMVIAVMISCVLVALGSAVVAALWATRRAENAADERMAVAEAYAQDRAALKLCVEGAMEKKDKGLTPIQKVFFYMPLQHTESRKVQAKSVELFTRLAESVSRTYRETFLTIAQFAELHKDIIDRFDRYPHRNAILGRTSTAEEIEFLKQPGSGF